MAKVKIISTTSLPSKGSVKLLKEGGVQKKKNQNFKKTPGGKIALINGSKGRNSNAKPQKELESSPESPQVKSKKKKQQLQSPQKLDTSIKDLVPKEEESDSEEDINEGIVLEEELSFVQDGEIDDNEDDDDDDEDDDDDDDDEDDEEEQSVKVVDLLGASLADDTDEDDEDFQETEEDEEKKADGKDKNKLNESNEVEQNKGVKMFKGLRSKNKNDDTQNKNSKQNKSVSDNNNSSSVDDEDDESDDANHEVVTEDVELGNSEDEEQDNEDDDEDEEGDEDDDDDDEDEDEDDDDDEEEEEEENALGLQALLGNSLADDDDDEDFEGDEEDDEDEDISDEEEEEGEENNSTLNTTKGSSVNDSTTSADLTEEEKEEKDKRTIFVGNLPKATTKQQLMKLFKKFGPVESVRLRGAVPEQLNVPKKVAAITKKLHPQLKHVIAYVLFKSEDSAKAALSMNGKVYEGCYLRVDKVVKNEDETYDPKKCVFLGNLPYNIDNNSIWELFKDCGQVESVRVIRDNKTGASKGIGYVNFTSEDAVALALELDGQVIGKREIRIKPCTANSSSVKKQKSKASNKRSLSNESGNENSTKKFKTNAEAALHRKKQKAQKAGEKNSSPDKQTFEGQKADKKKKNKPNKTQIKKKFLAQKLMAKSKKPTK